jgi:hypothetical protein
LLPAVQGSAYQYFRLFASEFSQRACDAFRDVSRQLPIVAVHGDAHVLQFVVTQNSYGVEDFDRSGFGPSVVDIVRYSASLHLACREVSFSCDPELGVRTFVDAYRAALDHPVADLKKPAVVERLRQRVPDGSEWLAWAESLMLPLSPIDQKRVVSSTPEFVKQQLAVQPERPKSYYQVASAGRLSMGVGSGLERKLLFRIAGPSAAPGDDVIVEARTTTPHGPCDCVWWPARGRSFQAMLFMSLLGRRMPSLFGFGDYGGEGDRQEYWVQAWDPGYRELTLRDVESQEELFELARDAATQLAGHFWSAFPERLREHQRFAQLYALDLVEPRISPLARRLADDVVASWQQFRSRAAPTSPSVGSEGR